MYEGEVYMIIYVKPNKDIDVLLKLIPTGIYNTYKIIPVSNTDETIPYETIKKINDMVSDEKNKAILKTALYPNIINFDNFRITITENNMDSSVIELLMMSE